MAALAVLLGMTGLAQTEGSIFDTVRPQLVVTVQEHDTGADVVEISPVEADYPAELLQKQIENLGERLGGSLRGLVLDENEIEGHSPTGEPTGGPKMVFLRALFAVDGLVNGETGEVDLTPLARAFAGAPAPHATTGIAVIFNGFEPTEQTLKEFTSAAAEVESRVQSSPQSVEYRIQLKTQDPDAIEIKMSPPPKPAPEKLPPRPASPILTWSLVVLGSLAAGALVYFLVLRRLTRPA